MGKKVEEYSRRHFLRIAGGISLTAAVGAAAYYYGIRPRPIVTPPLSTINTTTTIPATITTQTTSTNPVVSYAKEQELYPDIIKQIAFLGEDGIDDKDRMLVDYLVDIQKFDFSSHQKKILIS